ncbi:hypothetical protein JCM10213_000058 [Rhodosporidiobolus nylandii]
MLAQQHTVTPSDLSVLSLLTQDNPPSAHSVSATASADPPQQPQGHDARDSRRGKKQGVDPLMVAAAASNSVTRNHFVHSFYPQHLAYASCDDERIPSSSTSPPPGSGRPKMESRQAPRSIRLKVEEEEQRRKALAERVREERLKQQEEVKGLPAAVAVPTEDGGFEIKEDGKLEAEQKQEKKPRGPGQLPPGAAQVRTLQKEALVDLLRQPSTPPPLEKPLPSPPFLTSAPSGVRTESPSLAASLAAVPPATDLSAAAAPPQPGAPLPPLEVQCRVRTRIPTPHGHIFLHLYTNNHDQKEHLAFVADHAQMASTSLTTNAVDGTAIVAETGEKRLLPFIRSSSLDAKWHEGETDEERIVRGAYVGRLSADSQIASSAHPHSLDPTPPAPHAHGQLHTTVPSSSSAPSHRNSTSTPTDPPLVRIHSECFTGETIGSQRCDCGEQLDEAFRLITLAGRGVVVYLRQEGRGIGLLEKMRAYNLQDLGHDTVTANLMLGHGADLRTYGVAGAILRDLGVAEDGVRLLTNNPDKIRQIEGEGVRVRERVAMVPRSWMAVEEALARQEKRRERRKEQRTGARRPLQRHQCGRNEVAPPESVESSVASLAPSASISAVASPSLSSPASASPSASPSRSATSPSPSDSDSDSDSADAHSAASLAYHLRRAGVGMIGASTTASPELEKYLRTKIERMGHMLSVPGSQVGTPTEERGEAVGEGR